MLTLRAKDQSRSADKISHNVDGKWKFVIVSPRQTSGGAIVEHLLCKILMEKGYDAKIFYFDDTFTGKDIRRYQTWKRYLKYIYHDTTKLIKCKLFANFAFIQKARYKGYHYEPVRGCARKYLPWVDEKTIVVYSEGVYGNPLNAQNVVRWFLYTNRHPGDYEAYGEKDLFFSFLEVFNDKKVNPDCRLLHVNNFDYSLYYDHNNSNRNGKCYIVRKGASRKDLPDKFDGIVIDNLSEKEIVNVFNSCEYCISYDTRTFYATIAAVCGCISIVVPEPGKTRSDYTRKGNEMFGVAYGYSEEELKYAKDTRSLLWEKINGYKQANDQSVEYFIKECKEYFC